MRPRGNGSHRNWIAEILRLRSTRKTTPAKPQTASEIVTRPLMARNTGTSANARSEMARREPPARHEYQYLRNAQDANSCNDGTPSTPQLVLPEATADSPGQQTDCSNSVFDCESVQARLRGKRRPSAATQIPRAKKARKYCQRQIAHRQERLRGPRSLFLYLVTGDHHRHPDRRRDHHVPVCDGDDWRRRLRLHSARRLQAPVRRRLD